MGVIIGHTLLISLLGVLGSIVIMQGIGWITQTIIAEQTGVLLHGMNLQYEDLWVIGGIIIAGLIGGLGAAINAYRSDLVDNLQPTS
jgi:ABC-type antimicrobial peptide transport system permease subunit